MAEAIEMLFASSTRMGPGKYLLHIADRFEANTVLCSFNAIQTSSFIRKDMGWRLLLLMMMMTTIMNKQLNEQNDENAQIYKPTGLSSSERKLEDILHIL